MGKLTMRSLKVGEVRYGHATAAWLSGGQSSSVMALGIENWGENELGGLGSLYKPKGRSKPTQIGDSGSLSLIWLGFGEEKERREGKEGEGGAAHVGLVPGFGRCSV